MEFLAYTCPEGTIISLNGSTEIYETSYPIQQKCNWQSCNQRGYLTNCQYLTLMNYPHIRLETKAGQNTTFSFVHLFDIYTNPKFYKKTFYTAITYDLGLWTLFVWRVYCTFMTTWVKRGYPNVTLSLLLLPPHPPINTITKAIRTGSYYGGASWRSQVQLWPVEHTKQANTCTCTVAVQPTEWRQIKYMWL